MALGRKQLHWSSSSPGTSRWSMEGVGFFGSLWDLALGLPHPLTQPARAHTQSSERLTMWEGQDSANSQGG